MMKRELAGHAKRRSVAAVGTVVALLLAVGLTACGSSGSDSGTNGGSSGEEGSSAAIEQVKKLVAAQQELPTWKSPGPAFDASKASGKKLWYIPVSNDIPLSNTLGETMVEAGKTVGVSVTTCDGKGQVSQFAQCVEQGIAQGADAILLQTIPTELVAPQVRDAKKAGIPVIQSQEHDPGAPTPVEQETGVVAKVGFNYTEAGRHLAEAAIADAGGKMHAVAIKASDVPSSENILNGLHEQFQKYCPECTLEIKDVPVSKWATEVPTLVESVAKDPSVEYIIPIFDNMATFAVPAVNAAGAGSRIKIVTFNATPAVMKNLAENEVVVAEVGNANVWAGWAFMDQALRVLTGTPPLKDELIPFRTFTGEEFDGSDWKPNIGTIDVNAPENTWYGNADYAGEYEKLWGVK
jgi:ribose transport system substrate-binding protein